MKRKQIWGLRALVALLTLSGLIILAGPERYFNHFKGHGYHQSCIHWESKDPKPEK